MRGDGIKRKECVRESERERERSERERSERERGGIQCVTKQNNAVGTTEMLERGLKLLSQTNVRLQEGNWQECNYWASLSLSLPPLAVRTKGNVFAPRNILETE